MKLDKRIKDTGSILTCFSIEAAKEYLGQKGYFTNSIDDYQSLEQFTDFRTLSEVTDDDTPFCTGQCCYQFFLPAEFVRPAETPAEKKWRPFFTADEFRAKFPLLSPVTYREKKYSNCYTVCVIGIGRGRNGIVRVNLGGFFYEFQNLFNCFDLQDKDGNWAPFGVEE